MLLPYEIDSNLQRTLPRNRDQWNSKPGIGHAGTLFPDSSCCHLHIMRKNNNRKNQSGTVVSRGYMKVTAIV